MADIKVIVKDETGQQTTTLGNTPTTSQEASAKLDPKNASSKQTKKTNKTLAVASMIGHRALSYTTSNVGKWTGNHNNQAYVNAAQEAVGIGIAAYVNPYLAIAVVAMKLGTTAIDSAYVNEQERLKSNNRLLRGGYTNSGEVLGGRK